MKRSRVCVVVVVGVGLPGVGRLRGSHFVLQRLDLGVQIRGVLLGGGERGVLDLELCLDLLQLGEKSV